MKTLNIISIVLYLGLFSCSFQEKIYIVTGYDEVIEEAGEDLAGYLDRTYPGNNFEVVAEEIESGRSIVLEISSTQDFINNEAYQISGDRNSLYIRGKSPRAIVNGVFGLLKYLGWSFYLSFEVPPSKPKPLEFSSIYLEDAPLKERRIIFNWHNFLSGCTGWDYDQWQQWVQNASKIGFNTVMVHAYGNNPMHSFSYNGKTKELGYLTTTQKGRDWGAQHVNDARLLYGGEIFSDYEFGAKAAKVPEADRSKAAKTLMKKVFNHATLKGVDICFALDIDTWMANPQNVINTIPEEALIEIEGYKTVNPEHPEGKKYYKAQLTQLLSDYPEITVLTAWMRRPEKKSGHGSIWLLHESNTLPEKWRKEYFEIIKRHPQLKNERPYPGLFAISKIIKVYREILDEIKPGIELDLGSWNYEFIEMADLFMSEYCGFIPLDYSYILDQPEVIERLEEVGNKRRIYPIVWAHHDDHRYIGRPYIPYSDFHSLLQKTNSTGYGIIHWMTHPLDLFFSNYENQVWQNSQNEILKETVSNFTLSMVKKEEKNLGQYYHDWFNEAPMFGRETSDYFMRLDKDYKLEGYHSSIEVVEKAKHRLSLLQATDTNSLNKRGVKEYHYQKGLENFIISFFFNHHNGHKAYMLLERGNQLDALPFVQKLKPTETIDIYSKAISGYGATRGEEGLLISLNLRWLPDLIDLKQRAGMEPILINFQPTSHDPLAQGAGENTFFIDGQKNFWLSQGEKELGISAETAGKLPLEKVTDSWLNISGEKTIHIKTIRHYNLAKSDYKIQLLFGNQNDGGKVWLVEDDQVSTSFNIQKFKNEAQGSFKTGGGEVLVRIKPDDGLIKLAGITVTPE